VLGQLPLCPAFQWLLLGQWLARPFSDQLACFVWQRARRDPRGVRRLRVVVEPDEGGVWPFHLDRALKVSVRVEAVGIDREFGLRDFPSLSFAYAEAGSVFWLILSTTNSAGRRGAKPTITVTTSSQIDHSGILKIGNRVVETWTITQPANTYMTPPR